MIWTVVLWLGMQGQAQWPTDGQGQLQSLCMYSNRGDWRPCGPIHATTAPKNYNAPPNLIEPIDPTAPAEHVFEIRTTWTGVESCYCNNPGHFGCDPKDLCKERRAHRELWLDGKRLGIIKGLD